MAGLTDVIVSSGIGSLVSKISPVLGALLGSPLAGIAISFLANRFNVDPHNLTELAQKISNDPHADIKIKQMENDHQEVLAILASQDYHTEVDDRKDARANSVNFRDFMRHMAYLVTAGFFGALFLLFMPIPLNQEEKELLSMLVGMLVSKWQTIIDFFYGSSRKQGGFK